MLTAMNKYKRFVGIQINVRLINKDNYKIKI
jgi:hypothetical protein